MGDNTMKKKRKKKKKGFFSDNKIKFLIILLAVFLALALTGAGAAYAVIRAYVEEIPEMDFDQLIPSNTSTLYDKNGDHWMDVYGDENRVQVPLDFIPQHVQDAFIAIEDERFYDHTGIDLKAIGRAFMANLRRQRTTQGGSTITQQLVKNAFLTPDRTYKRKIQEAYLAYQLERHFHKDEILEYYLNWIYFDYSTNGVEAASQMFYRKSVNELTLAEAAYMAGVPNNPSLFSPYRNSEGFKNRQLIILGKMLELEMISQEEYQAAKEEEVEIHPPPSRTAPHFHFYEYVLYHELKKIIPTIPGYEDVNNYLNIIYKGGLHIYTTLDPELQEFADEIVNNPANYPTTVVDRTGKTNPQANVVLAEPETGYIRVLQGGRDAGKDNQILRFNVGRDTGSAIKPIIAYAPALEEKVITTATPIDDAPVQFGSYRPENFFRQFYGIVNMREALVRSFNVSAVKVFDAVGVSKGVEYAQRFGLESLIDPPGITSGGERKHDHNISATLGGLTLGVTTLEMVQSFGVLANGGLRIDLSTISRIEDSKGNIIYEHKPEPVRVVSAETAYIMNHILMDVTRTGTGSYLRLNRPLAAKTGTSESRRTGYLVAYTRDYVMGYWMGYDFPKDGEIRSPWTHAPKFFNPILKKAHEGLPVRSFKRPSSIVSASVCVKSGMRPGPNCPEEHIVSEIFVRGTAPSEECDKHITMVVCAESGLLPSEFCPDHLLEERVLFNRPEYLTTTRAWPGGAGRTPPDIENMIPTEICNIHTERPQPPQNLSYSLGDGSVTLQWTAAGGKPIEGYLVFRQLKGEQVFVRLTENPIKNLSYTDTTVQEKKTYVYQVVSINKEGTFSQGASITVEVPEKIEYTLEVKAAEGGTATGGGQYLSGTMVEIKATANYGWKFKEWQGEGIEDRTKATTKVRVNNNKTVTAVFEKLEMYKLDYTIVGSGSVELSPEAAGNSYPSGTKVMLTAKPQGQFEKWVYNGNEFTDPTLEITMDGNKSVVAHFKTDNGTALWWPFWNRFLSMF